MPLLLSPRLRVLRWCYRIDTPLTQTQLNTRERVTQFVTMKQPDSGRYEAIKGAPDLRKITPKQEPFIIVQSSERVGREEIRNTTRPLDITWIS